MFPPLEAEQGLTAETPKRQKRERKRLGFAVGVVARRGYFAARR